MYKRNYMKHLFQKVTLILLIAGLIFYSCKKESSCEGCQTNQPTSNTNKRPIALAGTDQTVTLPSDSILLDGSASNDPDGSITAWAWTKISGPLSFVIVNPSDLKTQVNNLAEGIYLFELKVMDNEGLSASDTMQVTVNQQVSNSSDDVYIVGSNGDHALLWKNGVVQALPDAGFGSFALSVFVSGSDVHVAGLGPNGSLLGADALYWKNGILQNFGEGYGTSVFVSGNDVYMAGGALWKNGIAQNLGGFWPYYVFVSGNDIYLAGYDPGSSGAALWKNGIVQNLGQGDPSSVFASGGDVYVTGTVANSTPGNYSAILWKNGIVQNLGQGGAASVFVSGSNVYVAGTKDGAATLWKNGLATSLGTGSANSVFVSGNDVYVVGTKNGIATLWINRTEYSISGLTGATSVFVK